MFRRAASAAICFGLSLSSTPLYRSSTPPDRLFAAIRSADLNAVSALLSMGADANARDDAGSTPLMYAAFSGDATICRALLQHGAEVNARDSEIGSTALERAVLTSHVDVEKLLLGFHARTDIVYRDGETVLHLAAARGNPSVVEPLLDAHADVRALDAKGNTPLDEAILHNQTQIVVLLIRHGADVAYVHPVDGRGVLHEVALRGFAAMVAPLVEAGADPVARDRSGQTPLDVALDYQNANVVKALLDADRERGLVYSQAEAAMETAAMRGQTEIARLLIEGGVDVTKPVSSGTTFLHDAALKGQTKVARLLLEYGALVNSLNQTGGTPLHDAALGGSPEMIALLLDHGAAINARDRDDGATALMLAASVGRSSAVALLLARGANAALRDNHGRTALDRARDTDDPKTQALLKAALRPPAS